MVHKWWNENIIVDHLCFVAGGLLGLVATDDLMNSNKYYDVLTKNLAASQNVCLFFCC